MSIGLSVQEKKRKIDFQDGGHGPDAIYLDSASKLSWFLRRNFLNVFFFVFVVVVLFTIMIWAWQQFCSKMQNHLNKGTGMILAPSQNFFKCSCCIFFFFFFLLVTFSIIQNRNMKMLQHVEEKLQPFIFSRISATIL